MVHSFKLQHRTWLSFELSLYHPPHVLLGFPGGSAGEESACVAGDLGTVPGLGSSLGGGNGYPLQFSGLENCMDYIVHGVTKSWAFWAIFTYISTYNNYYHLTWEHSMPNRWEQSWPVEEHREEPDLQEMIPGASQILFCASYWFFSKPIIFWRSCGLMHGRKLPCKLQMA